MISPKFEGTVEELLSDKLREVKNYEKYINRYIGLFTNKNSINFVKYIFFSPF